jgi:uncharacterized glyoxalase superfamily protein PhnB
MSMVKFEGCQPILRVADIATSIQYYVGVLGFTNAEWGNDDFTSVSRDGAAIYLCRGGQGSVGTWVWIGVDDVEVLYAEYLKSGANIRRAPESFPWAYEMRVEDLDGHVLRFGSEPKIGMPFSDWSD